MLKFLRRYQAWIMAVGGSLLMVAFLLPRAIQQLANVRSNKDVFQITVDGSTINVTSLEWQEASSEMAILEAMMNTRDIGPSLGFPPYDSDDAQSKGMHGTDHWILLKRAAQQAGLIGGPGDGDYKLQQDAALYAETQPATADEIYARLMQVLGSEAAKSHMTLDEGKQAFATLEGIRRLLHEYSSAAVPSDNRVRHLVNDFEDRVNIGFVFVDATSRIADEPEPTEAALQAQFEKYRDVAPGEGEQGFGYRLPDRVKFEYLKIDYKSLYNQVAPSGLEARKWYQQHTDQARANPDGSTPSFDEVADDAISAYRRAKAEEMMTEISRLIKGELLKTIQPLAHDGMYRVLPDNWPEQRVSFEALRDAIQQQFGATVEYHADTKDWTPVADLGSVEGIGGASRTAGVAKMSFSQLVQAHHEIGKTNVPGLQVGLADPTLLRRSDFAGGRVGDSTFPSDAFLYRVVAVDLARPATTLDEVKDAVVKDVKRLSAYDKLVAGLDAWWRRGMDEGLDDLAKAEGTFVRRGGISDFGVSASESGDFKPAPISGIDSPTLVKAVMDRSATFDLMQKYSELPMEQRLVATPVPEQLGIAVARLDSHFPPTRQRWLELLGPPGQGGGLRLNKSLSAVGTPLMEVVMKATFDDRDLTPFSFDVLKQRFNFVDMRSDADKEASQPQGVGEPSDAG